MPCDGAILFAKVNKKKKVKKQHWTAILSHQRPVLAFPAINTINSSSSGVDQYNEIN